MKNILMMLGCTAGQAAARAPIYTLAAGFTACVVLVIVFDRLDSAGLLDGLGSWIGRTLRHTSIGRELRRILK